MKKSKSLTKFKFENVIFIALVITFLYGATTRITSVNNVFGDLSNFYTVIFQLILSYGFKLFLEYIRKNPEEFAQSIRELFQDN